MMMKNYDEIINYISDHLILIRFYISDHQDFNQRYR